MSDGEVFLTFGADTSELELALANAKASVSALTSELASLSRQQVAAGASADSDLGRKMQDVAAHLAAAKTAAVQAADAIKNVGASAREAGDHASVGAELFDALRSASLSLAGVTGAAFSLDAMRAWVVETAKLGDGIDSFAAKLGTSFHEIQTIQGVAALSGGDGDALLTSLRGLTTELSKTPSEAAATNEALKAIGIEFDSLKGKSPVQLIEAIAQGMSHFADGANKTAVAQKLLGAAAVEMLRSLDLGRAGIQDLEQQVERSGNVMSDAAVQASSQTEKHLRELAQAWNAHVGAGIMLSVDAAVQAFTHLVESIDYARLQEAAKTVGDALIDAAATVAEFLARVQVSWDAFLAHFGITSGELGAGLVGFLNNLSGQNGTEGTQTALRDAGAAADALGDKLEGAGRRIAVGMLEARDKIRLMNGEISQADFDARREELEKLGPASAAVGEAGKAAGKQLVDAFNGAGDSASKLNAQLGAIKDAAESAKASFHAMAGGLTTALSANATGGPYDYNPDAKRPGSPSGPAVKPIGLSPDSGKDGADDAARLARATFESESLAAQEAYESIQHDLGRLLDSHQITFGQWLTQSTGALDREQDAIQDSADKALATAGLTSAQKLELANREEREMKRIAQALMQDQDKAAKETLKAWDASFSAINSAFDSQVDGLLKGTTSWAQAVKNVLASLTEDVIKFALKWALQQAETVALNIAGVNAEATAHIAANATKTSSDAAAAGASAFTWVASALKTIAADAAQVFGGVFAFLAPVMGPFAAGPATAAAATVTAAGGAIASADIGMWQVPRDQLALVHHNELIMPAGQAGAFRDLLSGGGEGRTGPNISISPQLHFTNNTVDSRGLETLLTANGGALMRAVASAVHDGAHLGMRRLRLT